MATLQLRHTITTADDIGPNLLTSGNPENFSSLATKTLVVKLSTDGGSTFPTTRTHTFGAGPFNGIGTVVADLQADATFSAGLTISAQGTELSIIWSAAPAATFFLSRAKVDATSTGINGAGLLAYTSGQTASPTISTATKRLKITVGSDHFGSLAAPETAAVGEFVDLSERQFIFQFTPYTVDKNTLINASKFVKSAVADLVNRGKVEVQEVGTGNLTAAAIYAL